MYFGNSKKWLCEKVTCNDRLAFQVIKDLISDLLFRRNIAEK